MQGEPMNKHEIAALAYSLTEVEKHIGKLRLTRASIADFTASYDANKMKEQCDKSRGWEVSSINLFHNDRRQYLEPNKEALKEIGRVIGYLLLASYDRQIAEAEKKFESLHKKIQETRESEPEEPLE
jgi:hypothetical protein